MTKVLLSVFSDLLKSLFAAPLVCTLMQIPQTSGLASSAFEVLSILVLVHFVISSSLSLELIRDVTHREQATLWLDSERSEMITRYAGLTLIFITTTFSASLAPGAGTFSAVNIFVTAGIITFFAYVYNCTVALIKLFEKAKLIRRLPKRNI